MPGLMVLARLPADAVTQLQTAFAEMPARLDTDYLAEHAAQTVPQLAEDARDVVEALLSMMTLIPEDGSGVPDLADDVASSTDLALANDERAAFAERLTPLLGLECLAVAARASELTAEHEHIFCDARVIMDVRPVFGRDATEGPKAAAIASALKISFHRYTDELDTLFIGLQRTDLLRLRAVIDRALAKHDGLHAMIARDGLPQWEWKGERDASDD